MFAITQEDRATIYLLGENPDERGAGRQYRTGADVIQTIRNLMRGGVGFVELHRAGYPETAADDIINIAAIGFIERYTVPVKTTARVELWQSSSPVGPVFVVDPDQPGAHWMVTAVPNGEDWITSPRTFGSDAAALVDGEYLELRSEAGFQKLGAMATSVKVAVWKPVGTQGAGSVDLLVPVTDLAASAASYLGTSLLEGVRKLEPEPAGA